MAPELETLDQLLGGDMPLNLVRGLFEDDAHFARAVAAMLDAGEVRLIGTDGTEVPRWRWREALAGVAGAQLSIAAAGIQRIGG